MFIIYVQNQDLTELQPNSRQIQKQNEFNTQLSGCTCNCDA